MKIKKVVTTYFYNPNYAYFLASLVLLILLPPFIFKSFLGILSFKIIYGIVLFLGSFHITQNLKQLLLSVILSALVYLSFLLNIESYTLGVYSLFLSTALFTLFLIHLIKYIISMKKVNANSLFACISGYILLGIVASFLFTLLNLFTENTAFNIASENFYDLLYFSFTTITSVGYGDIVPVSQLAKSVTILVSVLGQIYLTFLVAIIIGKYLVTETKETY
ncbi:MAG: ion channel [Polaribacter sp.]|nr:ion channel [Polaribacter sp.]MDG1811959.1 ion channel [Polaribacter sp.]MDG1992985.1 ion channel [Polaribacter sp.]